MRCAVCKKTSDQAELFEGIMYDEMIRICEGCANKEKIPRIKKPSSNQLEKADQRYSVRERMENLSGMRNRTELSSEQTAIQGNLARLKMPDKKEFHDDVYDNYYWAVNMGRRRKKMSISQLSKETGVAVEVIKDVEKGKIPKDFETVFLKLESFLRVKLLKRHTKKVNFKRDNRNEEKEILELVQKKLNQDTGIDVDDLQEEEFEDSSQESSSSSNKPTYSDDVTLDELIEQKRKKEKKERTTRRLIQTDSLLGDDIELDEDLT